MHIKIKNKLYLIAWNSKFEFKKFGFSMQGLFSYRKIYIIRFIQIDIFYD